MQWLNYHVSKYLFKILGTAWPVLLGLCFAYIIWKTMSGLSLLCLPKSNKKAARLIWVNELHVLLSLLPAFCHSKQ